MIINPGSTHFDDQEAEHSPLVTYDDYPNAATLVDALDNDPAAVIED